ncbi:NAD-dependent histone deacetylase HST3 [Spathaspora sp. JA1]|nr:NAD-dependent histone deacetylase HST3 [Spathaspora sp. JA1]
MITLDLSDQSDIPSDTTIRLNEVIKHIAKSKKCTVLTGAGISCNAGIPDFRSSDGLYNLVKQRHPQKITRGQDLFDISLFRDEISLSLFCTFMESLYKSSLKANATETHKFIKVLKDKNKLLRCYTQNIDCLEQRMNLNLGINLKEFDANGKFNEIWKNLDVIQLHGNLHKLSCTLCFSNFDWTEKFQSMLSQGLNPECSKCYAKYEERLYSGKRLTGNIGILRPDIVLYGENHPQSELLSQGLNVDLKSKPDLLIIMGTSLKVDGVKRLVKCLSKSIHEKNGKVLFINKTPLSKQWKNYIDYEILCDCDEFVRILKMEIPDLFLTQEQLDSKKLNNPITENIKQEVIPIKRKQTVKQERIKQEIEKKVLTPPTTPTKKRSPAPSLKRKRQTQDSTSKKLKFEMMTPVSSFSESDSSLSSAATHEVIVIDSDSSSSGTNSEDDKPLSAICRSRLNSGITRSRVKQEIVS